MNITMLQDYRGVLTAERYFPEGAVIDLDNEVNEGIDGDGLIEAGRAKSGGAKPKKKKGAKKSVPKKD